MKTGLFWKVCAAGALVVMAAYVGVLLRDGRPVFDKVQAGGGGIDGVIAFTSDAQGTSRLFLVNPSKKTICVYQAGDKSGVMLVCGRGFAKDEELCAFGGGADIPLREQGYKITEVVKMLNDLTARGARP
jgi:hypothetical protein